MHTLEYLNSIRCSGISNYKLKLKRGVPFVLLKNIDQRKGLCNGTGSVITQLEKHVIERKVISRSNIGEKIFIPRMNLIPSDSRLCFKFQ